MTDVVHIEDLATPGVHPRGRRDPRRHGRDGRRLRTRARRAPAAGPSGVGARRLRGSQLRGTLGRARAGPARHRPALAGRPHDGAHAVGAVVEEPTAPHRSPDAAIPRSTRSASTRRSSSPGCPAPARRTCTICSRPILRCATCPTGRASSRSPRPAPRVPIPTHAWNARNRACGSWTWPCRCSR